MAAILRPLPAVVLAVLTALATAQATKVPLSRRDIVAAARRAKIAATGHRALESEIKQAFRALAMRFHPDTRGADVAPEEADEQMTEVVDAYTALTDASFGAEDLVAAACEMFSLAELRADAFHDVHDVALLLEQPLLDGAASAPAEAAPELRADLVPTGRDGSEADRVDVHCCDEDAVSDIKRVIEDACGGDWDLAGRPKDRDGLATGWELVNADGTPLSSHFFLLDYNLKRGDVLHAVVRRRA